MTEGMGDQEKMIQPQDVAEAALLPLRTTGGATPKEVGLQRKVLAGSPRHGAPLPPAAQLLSKSPVACHADYHRRHRAH